MNTTQWAIGIIVVAAIIIGGFWYMNGAHATSLVLNDNAVLFQDQKPGEEAVVAYAKLSKPGYVVLFANDASGTKTVAGQSDLLSAGEHRNVRVHASGGALVTGTTLTAAVVADDGNGTYDASDTEVLAGGDEATTASVSDTATLDESLSDDELATLLDDAGYDLTDAGKSDEDAAMHDDAMMESTSSDSMHDDMGGEDLSASSTDDAMMHSDDEMNQGDTGEGEMMNH